MSWATRRRFMIIAGISVVVLLVAGGIGYATIHKEPSCSDSKQNQDEEGVDCGGACSYLCTMSQTPPSAKFARALSQSGRTDFIAYVDNPNPASAAKGLGYTIELYGPTNEMLTKKEGKLDLAPVSTVPLFVPNIYSGSEEVTRAFVTFETGDRLWFRDTEERRVPTVRDIAIVNGDLPRITAVAVNPTANALRNVTFIVTVFDTSGNAIAASQTIVPSLTAQGTAPLVFTWSAPFNGTISRVDVLPVLPLTTRAGSL